MIIKRLLVIVVGMVLSLTVLADDLNYVSLSKFPVYGTAVPNATKKYSRLPDSLKGKIRDELWQLGLNSAGLSIRFATDASTIAARWTNLNKFSMNHMTPTGIRGLDLYVLQDDGTWTNVGSARPVLGDKTTRKSTIISDMEPKMREYMLFLPLYDGVDDIYIGVNSGAKVVKPTVDLPVRDRPVVMYGTSILQGGCATRPGMAHTNILQRMLNREVINLGFSGNARLDPEIARLMATIDASVYVLDMLPNTTTEMLNEKIDAFYDILRQAHPDTPILLIENPEFPSARFNKKQAQELAVENAALRDFYVRRRTAGDENVYYFNSLDILCGNTEATVDNSHFTDTGFAIYARTLYPVIKHLINPEK